MVIARTWIVDIAAVAGCYLITNYVKNIKEATVPNMPSCKISWWKNVSEKGKNYSHLIYNIFSLGKMAGKTFSRDKLNINLRLSIY